MPASRRRALTPRTLLIAVIATAALIGAALIAVPSAQEGIGICLGLGKCLGRGKCLGF